MNFLFQVQIGSHIFSLYSVLSLFIQLAVGFELQSIFRTDVFDKSFSFPNLLSKLIALSSAFNLFFFSFAILRASLEKMNKGKKVRELEKRVKGNLNSLSERENVPTKMSYQ